MTEIEIDAGTLEFSESDALTATGLLIPFDEVCKSNLGRFSVGPDSFTIPTDLTGASLNVEHTREDVVGGLSKVTQTDKGYLATFSFADTDEGRAAYEDAKSGKRKHLSAEVAGVVIKGGKAIAGRLFAAALVRRPAFPSATLLAAAADTTEHHEDEYTDENGVVWRRVSDSETKTEGDTTTTVTTVTETAPENPDTTEEDAVGTATVPNTLQATAPASKQLDKSKFFDVMHAIRSGNADETLLAAFQENIGVAENTLFAALTSVKYDGSGGLTTNIQQPQWLGQVWDGNTYVQKFIPLFNHADLTGLNFTGYKWNQKPEGGTWAGNKAAVPSNAPTFSAVTGTASRFAGGHDIAREFQDLQAFGDRGFFDAYFQAMAESYSKWADQTIVAAAVLDGATTLEADNPSGLAIGAGLSAIVDGAAAVLAANATPTFALVELSLWKAIAKIPSDSTLGYLNAALHLTGESGQLDSFVIQPTDQLDTGNVLVGAREAATVYELPGAPIRVSAPDMVNGGIDTGIFGYCGVVINKATALQLVTPYTA